MDRSQRVVNNYCICVIRQGTSCFSCNQAYDWVQVIDDEIIIEDDPRFVTIQIHPTDLCESCFYADLFDDMMVGFDEIDREVDEDNPSQ